MKKIKIVSGEKLFNAWKNLSKKINLTANLIDHSCAGLFQNDIEVSINSLIKWRDIVIPGILEELDKRKAEILKLVEISKTHIKNTQGD